MGRWIEPAYRVFVTAVCALTNALLGLLVIVVLAAVAVRYFGLFEGSLHWANELSRFTMIWLVMLGGAIAFDRGAHLAITLMPDSAPETVRKPVTVLANLLSALFVGVLAWQGYVLSFATMRQVSPALDLPMGLIYLALPVGATLMALQSILFAFFPELRPKAKDPVPELPPTGS